MLKWFLSAVCATVDRDGVLLVRDPVLRAEVAIPARLLLRLCATCGVCRDRYTM